MVLFILYKGKHHNWMIRQLADKAMNVAPNREDLLKILGGEIALKQIE